MTLPTPINWLQSPPKTIEIDTDTDEHNSVLVFHLTEATFTEEFQMVEIIKSCVFKATDNILADIYFEGLIREEEVESCQEFLQQDEDFLEYRWQNEGGWVWIEDTLMNVTDKLEFVNQAKGDTTFWMLVGNLEEVRYQDIVTNRSGQCYILMIETKNLGNWSPFIKTKTDFGEIPHWIAELGTVDDSDYEE